MNFRQSGSSVQYCTILTRDSYHAVDRFVIIKVRWTLQFHLSSGHSKVNDIKFFSPILFLKIQKIRSLSTVHDFIAFVHHHSELETAYRYFDSHQRHLLEKIWYWIERSKVYWYNVNSLVGGIFVRLSHLLSSYVRFRQLNENVFRLSKPGGF